MASEKKCPKCDKGLDPLERCSCESEKVTEATTPAEERAKLTPEQERQVLDNFTIVDRVSAKAWDLVMKELDQVDAKKRWILVGRIVARLFSMHYQPSIFRAEEITAHALSEIEKA